MCRRLFSNRFALQRALSEGWLRHVSKLGFLELVDRSAWLGERSSVHSDSVDCVRRNSTSVVSKKDESVDHRGNRASPRECH
jgi:hypothetical protein